MPAPKSEFLDKFLAAGPEKFYKFLLTYAIYKVSLLKEGESKGLTPEIELMNFYDKFLTLFRRHGKPEYLEISKIFRRVSHKIYRVMLRGKLTKRNNKFLNLV